jgi:predicted ATP-dependent endonuclease of OLD family
MRIATARVKSYRTIRDELEIGLADGVTLVGPNNAGKTNLLKGIRLFFTGYENDLGYSRAEDLTAGENSAKTTITLTFSGDRAGVDADIYGDFDRAKALLKLSAEASNEFSIYLSFSNNSNPSYRLFPNSKRPEAGSDKATYSRVERGLVDAVLRKFSVHYIPSDKSSEQLYRDLVLPFLFQRSFAAIEPHLQAIRDAMQGAADELNGTLKAAGLQHIECSFEFPTQPTRFFKEADFFIRDPHSTSIFSKGMGIQSAALLAAFNWITTQEISSGKSVLWLLEEPESYLHPELSEQCGALISKLRQKSQVVATTHSLSFVPQDPKAVVGVELDKGWTVSRSFKTFHEASDRIRRSLGVRFSDFYNLNLFNLFVEGETDREALQSILAKISTNPTLAREFPILLSRDFAILDYGGISGLVGFLRATYEFIKNERACFVMFDGDDAGDKGRRELQGYFGQKKIGFEVNRNFVLVRQGFAMEGLFPDLWIQELNAAHPSWIADYAVDASGAVMPFRVDQKRQFVDRMLEKVDASTDFEWAARWLPVLRAIEAGLSAQWKALQKVAA